jgi:hypothetical protein
MDDDGVSLAEHSSSSFSAAPPELLYSLHAEFATRAKGSATRG